MIWTDDFTGGDMDSVEKLSDGLHLKDKDALLITGPGEHVLVPGDPVFNVGGDITIEFLASGSSFHAQYRALGALNNNTANPELLIRTVYGNIEIFTNEGKYSFTQSLPNDVFYLAVAHRSSDNHTSITWNGVERATRIMRWDITGVVNFSMGVWMREGTTPYHPLLGKIAWVRLWNHYRTPAEIQADMYRVLKGDEPGLIGYWKYNEGSGTTVRDYGPNGLDGSCSTPSWTTLGRKWAGRRLVEIDLSAAGVATSSAIVWTSQEPAGTGVTIETNLSLDGGQTWQGWQTCTNGGEIPGITRGVNLSNARLKIWEHLHTEIEGVEPVLESLTIVVDEEGGVGHETFSDTVIKSYVERRTRSDIILTTAARRDTLSDIVLTTWPPHNTFSEVRLTRPVKRDTLCEVRVAKKHFVQPEPSPGAIWRPIRPGTGVWTPVPPGEKQPWKEGAKK